MARPRTLSTRELNRALLARQGLLERKRVSVPRMIERVGGLQTQEPRDAYISLWSRIEGFDRAKLERAADRREVVRGSWMRCTIHTVTAGDFRRGRITLNHVVGRDAAHWRDAYEGLDVAKVVKAVRKLLSDDVPRSGRQIGETIAPQFPGVSVDGLSHCARFHVPMVMTPGDGTWGYNRPPKLMLAERWLGELGPADPVPLLLQGLASIGPASTSDLRTWSGLAGIKEAMAPLVPDLKVFRDESGRELYDLPNAPRPKADTPAPVRFLGEFDNVFLSHADRVRIIGDANATKYAVGKNGRRLYCFLIDGFVGGIWKPTSARGMVLIDVQPFADLTPKLRREVEREAEALAELIDPGARVSVKVG